MRIGLRCARHVAAVLAAFGASCVLAPIGPASAQAQAQATEIVRSVRSGPWSSPDTWDGAKVPGAGARVQIRGGHTVLYDVDASTPIRFVHVAGTLRFARDRDTRLDVGILKIQPGDAATEHGAECDVHGPGKGPRATLEVGSLDAPIPAGTTATIRLAPFDGQDPDHAPALLSCAGRMELHGAPLAHAWVKLGAELTAGSDEIVVADDVGGWRPGDELVVTTTKFPPFFDEREGGGRKIVDVLDGTETEEVELVAVDRRTLRIAKPVRFGHFAQGRFRGEVANLSRNVVVESAQPGGVRGHTMYHHGSQGGISYVELRHLGKRGVLARYPVHVHLARDTMRGSAIVGASIWDSHNRWITIHGTDYLVVRDNVGYRSVGHGYFLEDGTEVANLFDRNLAVQALLGDPLPKQALPTDLNDGAGFWWANSQNSFTNNVAVECAMHGFRYQLSEAPGAAVKLPVRQADGTSKSVDVRTLPFLRFAGNEAHSQRRYALNLGGFNALGDNRDLDRDGNVLDRSKFLAGDVQGVGPDDRHPFVIDDFLTWRAQWGFHTGAPNVQFHGFTAYDVTYVVWRSNLAGHDYNDIDFSKVDTSSFFFNWAQSSNQSQTPSRYDLLRFLPRKDTLPPVTVITAVRRVGPGLVQVDGVSVDDDAVAEVLVNGAAAKLGAGPLHAWSTLAKTKGEGWAVEAGATDVHGNAELTPHRLVASAGSDELRNESVRRKPAVVRPSVVEDADAGVRARELAAALDAAPRARSRWPVWDGRESVADYAARAKLPATRTVAVGAASIELVLVPAGVFAMGSPSVEAGRADDEGPLHAVRISAPYYLGRTEVTQAQWRAVMGSDPSHFRDPQRPVEQVSWSDAVAFTERAGHGLRLPSEAEWEHACRAGTTTPYAGAGSVRQLESMAWFGTGAEIAQSVEHTHPVGGKAANALGLHDMHGNVYEWTADRYAPATYRRGASVDPRGPAQGDERSLRGGSWEAKPELARCANRNGYPAASKGYTVGFRVALSVEPQRKRARRASRARR